MNYLKILLPILLVTNSLYSQSSNTIRDFHNLTNKAELLICENEFAEAKKLYERAFKMETTALEMFDYRNYAVLCCKLKDYENFEKAVFCLAENGFKMELYEKLAVEYFDMEMEFPAVKPEIAIEKAVTGMMIYYDQKPRNDCPGYQKYCEADVAYVDSLNYLYLQKLYKEKGSWFFERNYKAYWLVILHNTQWQRYWMFDEMKVELEKGNIPVELYVNLVTRTNENNDSISEIFPRYDEEQLWLLNGKYYFLPDENKAQIDSFRQIVYFDSIDNQRKKIIFSVSQSKEEFRFFYNKMSSVSGMEEEEFEKFISWFKPIDEAILPTVNIN